MKVLAMADRVETADGSSSTTSPPGSPHPPAGVTTPAAPAPGPESVTPPQPTPAAVNWRRRIIGGAVLAIVALLVVIKGIPLLITALNTVSTDDAYVNSHVTFVAPRVMGQVSRVLVDDNYRVRKGDLLVQLDKEPFELDVAIKQAAVETAQANLVAAEAQTRSLVAQIRSNYYSLKHAMEQVDNEIAALHSNVDQLRTEEANLQLAERNYARNKPLVESGAVTAAAFDQYTADLEEARSRVSAALQVVQETRANLGLPTNAKDPLDVPDDIAQNYSAVRQALGVVEQSAAQIGYEPSSWNLSPDAAIAEFYRQDPSGDLDRIYDRLVAKAPAVQQAKAQLDEARADLNQSLLNLRYCDIVSEIDGVVTSRNVNPGNNVQVGQSLMAVRSLTDIWIDANFKETQLADLRIGQPVKIDVDMYGSRRTFEGRVSGFTMGTGQTLELLPPQNATGNFVKIVQRLPVRIDLINYNPDEATLFVGLSAEPYVYYKEKPTGPDAGQFLQNPASLPRPNMNVNGGTATTPQQPPADPKGAERMDQHGPEQGMQNEKANESRK